MSLHRSNSRPAIKARGHENRMDGSFPRCQFQRRPERGSFTQKARPEATLNTWLTMKAYHVTLAMLPPVAISREGLKLPLTYRAHPRRCHPAIKQRVLNRVMPSRAASSLNSDVEQKHGYRGLRRHKSARRRRRGVRRNLPVPGLLLPVGRPPESTSIANLNLSQSNHNRPAL